MIKQITLFLLFIPLFQFANAQKDSTFNETITFHPLLLVNSGIRIDYDRQLGNNHWIQIGPQFYASERNNEEYYREYDELLGIGISVFHRIYLGKKKPSLGTYFSYGFTYNYFNLKYEEDSDPAGDNILDETNINKFGGDIVIGYEWRAFDRLIIDMYAGLGGRYSERSYKGYTHKEFNESLYDYGFTGNVILMGIRIGFSF